MTSNDGLNILDVYCPACGGETLTCDYGGGIFCRSATCPRVFAAWELLSDRELHHVVDVGENDFTIRHPLIERLGDALLSCDLHRRLALQSKPPQNALGRFRVRELSQGEWAWERLDSDAEEANL